ncbi:MAG: T9SS type A sorting domain-containing protein [Saprospiraceae bacterium]|nr:T9SS type A sorting domain-containing protein [Saprospiraceae bacterium]
MKANILLVFGTIFVLNLSDLTAQCATGTLHMNYFTSTSGSGTYDDPALGQIEYGFCLTLESFFENQTNWAHGIFVAWEHIPNGVTITKGLTGEQPTQHGSRKWIWIDSLKARNFNLPGIGYYVDDGDGNPSNNYGDNGLGTPNAKFPDLSPFCFVGHYTCGAPTAIRPWVTVTGDGTTGGWNNQACPGDIIKSSSGGPMNDGILIVCGLVLPLELLSFEGYYRDNVNYIHWVGIADDLFSHYELEKRNSKSLNFTVLQNITISPNAVEHQQHVLNYIDSDIENEINYYRLKMVEKDNSYVYSKTIAILSPSSKTFVQTSVFPNPSSDEIKIGFPNAKTTEKYILELINIEGKVILNHSVQIKGSNQVQSLDISKIDGGVYFLKILRENSEIEIHKLIKKAL